MDVVFLDMVIVAVAMVVVVDCVRESLKTSSGLTVERHCDGIDCCEGIVDDERSVDWCVCWGRVTKWDVLNVLNVWDVFGLGRRHGYVVCLQGSSSSSV